MQNLDKYRAIAAAQLYSKRVKAELSLERADQALNERVETLSPEATEIYMELTAEIDAIHEPSFEQLMEKAFS